MQTSGWEVSYARRLRFFIVIIKRVKQRNLDVISMSCFLTFNTFKTEQSANARHCSIKWNCKCKTVR